MPSGCAAHPLNSITMRFSEASILRKTSVKAKSHAIPPATTRPIWLWCACGAAIAAPVMTQVTSTYWLFICSQCWHVVGASSQAAWLRVHPLSGCTSMPAKLGESHYCDLHICIPLSGFAQQPSMVLYLLTLPTFSAWYSLTPSSGSIIQLHFWDWWHNSTFRIGHVLPREASSSSTYSFMSISLLFIVRILGGSAHYSILNWSEDASN